MSMTVTEAVTHDHRELEDYYNNIKKAPDYDTATRWQNQFVWELARHSIGEVWHIRIIHLRVVFEPAELTWNRSWLSILLSRNI